MAGRWRSIRGRWSPMYRRKKARKKRAFLQIFGVTDGIRTHDNQNHNLIHQSNPHKPLRVTSGNTPHSLESILQGFAGGYSHDFRLNLPPAPARTSRTDSCSYAAPCRTTPGMRGTFHMDRTPACGSHASRLCTCALCGRCRSNGDRRPALGMMELSYCTNIQHQSLLYASAWITRASL